MDYYGSKLATASSDKSVRIFAVDSKTGGYHQLGVLTGFNGPVFKIWHVLHVPIVFYSKHYFILIFQTLRYYIFHGRILALDLYWPQRLTIVALLFGRNQMTSTTNLDGVLCSTKKRMALPASVSKYFCTTWIKYEIQYQNLLTKIVNAVAWSAPEFGAMLAAASSDGSLSVHSMDNQENWTSKVIPKAHEVMKRITLNESDLRER